MGNKSSLAEQFQRFVLENRLFSQPDRLLVAVSGGLDSVALVHLLYENYFQFGIAHVNFQLRGDESDGDADFVSVLADEYGVAYHEYVVDTKAAIQSGESVQMAARRLRYQWLENLRLTEGYDYILTAHHAFDGIETFLLNFLRGTGLRGLRGIPPRKEAIVRPLLFTDRLRLAAYVAEQELRYREDSSNLDDKYKRNRLRHEVLPALLELNPSLGETAAANFERLSQAYDLYRWAVEQFGRRLITTVDEKVHIDLAPLHLKSWTASLLHEWLSPYGFNENQIAQSLTAGTGTLFDSADYTLLVATDELILQKRNPAAGDDVYELTEAPTMIKLPNGEQLSIAIADGEAPPPLADSPPHEWIDAERLVYPLTVRHWQPGDWFQPLGMDGRRKKLQDYFVDEKIDRFERNKVWLLRNGNGDIIWIIGHRLDERYKIRPQTTRRAVVVYIKNK